MAQAGSPVRRILVVRIPFLVYQLLAVDGRRVIIVGSCKACADKLIRSSGYQLKPVVLLPEQAEVLNPGDRGVSISVSFSWMSPLLPPTRPGRKEPVDDAGVTCISSDWANVLMSWNCWRRVEWAESRGGLYRGKPRRLAILQVSETR